MKTFTNQLDLTAFWESFKAHTYPDPMSDLYRAIPKAPWGDKPIAEILKNEPPIYQQLDGEPFTIGFGQAHILPDGTPITPDMTCTEEQAKTWLAYRLTQYIPKVICNFLGEDIFNSLEYDSNGNDTYEKIDALSDYAYNCGIKAFPKLIAKLKDNDILGASLEFLDGFYVESKPVWGLLKRRISEYNTFVNGTYLAWEDGDPITQDLMNKLLAKNLNNTQAIKMINGFKIGVGNIGELYAVL